jgi:3'-phosphoadenosine 5'-phosphosulfate sulfotransferase (PAPS reductase)/FAD synthetase
MSTNGTFQEWAARPGRHIVNLSGGKDSTALAIFLRDKLPGLEYVFCDTHKELPETYDYLDRLEGFLGRPITRLNAQRGFDHWLDMYGGMLPSARMPT